MSPEKGQTSYQDQISPGPLADTLSDALVEALEKEPRNYPDHMRRMADLKHALVLEAAEAFYTGKYESQRPSSEFLWNLAEVLPDFNADELYRKRATWMSLAAAVFLGWLLGGLVSTFMGFLGMGGEILRPLVIFCMVWLCDYLGSNPRARNILLAALGLGGLARFAASAVAGMISFTSFGMWRQAIFGRMAMPNIFKSAWLFFGSFFVFVFLAKKISGLDLSAFRHSIAEQIGQRLKLADFIFSEIDKREEILSTYRMEHEKAARSGKCPRTDCELASAAISLLDALDPPKRDYLAEKLAAAGYAVQNAGNGELIWNSAEHGPLYETVGLINDGDYFRILRKACRTGDQIVKGHAQRVNRPAP